MKVTESLFYGDYSSSVDASAQMAAEGREPKVTTVKWPWQVIPILPVPKPNK